jgi:hypothetical protein
MMAMHEREPISFRLASGNCRGDLLRRRSGQALHPVLKEMKALAFL